MPLSTMMPRAIKKYISLEAPRVIGVLGLLSIYSLFYL